MIGSLLLPTSRQLLLTAGEQHIVLNIYIYIYNYNYRYIYIYDVADINSTQKVPLLLFMSPKMNSEIKYPIANLHAMMAVKLNSHYSTSRSVQSTYTKKFLFIRNY